MKTNNKVLTDKEIEAIWNELEDATMVEDNNGELILNSDFYIWSAGTSQSDIWYWFNENHSKGLEWLMEEYEG